MNLKQDEFNFKRNGSPANYFYLQGGFGQQYAWIKNLEFSYRLRGQYTQALLISNEQFSAGGVDSVRGYIESSALGDNGIQGTVALDYSLFGDKPPTFIQDWTLGVFVDAARLRVMDPLSTANIDTRNELLSAGVGMVMQAFSGMNLKLDYAKPLYKLQQDGFDDGAKLHFSLGYEF